MKQNWLFSDTMNKEKGTERVAIRKVLTSEMIYGLKILCA